MIIVVFFRGATALGCALVALFFARFWVTTLDRLFLWFSLAFAILATDYAVLGLLPEATEWRLSVFAIRLVAFCLILVGIFVKNRER
jgi:hypothetical protein